MSDLVIIIIIIYISGILIWATLSALFEDGETDITSAALSPLWPFILPIAILAMIIFIPVIIVEKYRGRIK